MKFLFTYSSFTTGLLSYFCLMIQNFVFVFFYPGWFMEIFIFFAVKYLYKFINNIFSFIEKYEKLFSLSE